MLSNPLIVDQWIKIGVVGKAHGLNGAFFVSDRDEPIPSSYKNLLVGKSVDSSSKAKITTSRTQGGRPVIHISTSTDRNSAEALVGQNLYVERSMIPIKADEFLWSDLEGRQVLDSAGVAIGQINLIHNQGASDIARVFSKDLGTLEIPLIADYFDMEFKEESVQLLVDAATFDGLWSTK